MERDGARLGWLRLEGRSNSIPYMSDDRHLAQSLARTLGVVLENAGKAMTAQQLLELKTESSDLVVTIGTRGDAVANMGYRLGRVANKLIKATREKIKKT